MRDMRRFRQRIEITLERRQAVTYGVGAVAAAALIFVTGVMVGRKTAPDDTARLARQPEPTSTTARPLRAMAPGASITPGVSAPTIQTPSAVPPLPGGAPAIGPGFGSPEPAGADELARRETRPHFNPRRTAPPPEANVKKPKNEVPVAAARGLDESVATGHYTCQVGSYQELDEAQAYAKGLSARGLSARVVRAHIPERGVWYRVRIGDYASELEATMAKSRLRADGIDAWVQRVE